MMPRLFTSGRINEPCAHTHTHQLAEDRVVTPRWPLLYEHNFGPILISVSKEGIFQMLRVIFAVVQLTHRPLAAGQWQCAPPSSTPNNINI